MATDLELPWTGERLVTSHMGDTALEHLHRYGFAREYARDKDVLDMACGEGYGSYHLAEVARSVVGVDIADEVVAHARRKYGQDSKVSFSTGSCTAIPLDDASVDLVVSFETLEHIGEHEQMLAEIKRVLRPGGTLVISTPDRLNCTIIPKNYNPYHVKELFKNQFKSLLESYFRRVYLFEQKICHASLMVPGAGQPIAEFRHYRGDFYRMAHMAGIAGALFNLAVATDGAAEPALNVSLFEGVGIPTEVEGRLVDAEGRLVDAEGRLAETRSQLAERETHIRWLEQHERDMEADYQALLAKQDASHREECTNLQSACRAFADADRARTQEMQSLRHELQLIEASRAWRLTQWIRWSVAPLRVLWAVGRKSPSLRH